MIAVVRSDSEVAATELTAFDHAATVLQGLVQLASAGITVVEAEEGAKARWDRHHFAGFWDRQQPIIVDDVVHPSRDARTAEIDFVKQKVAVVFHGSNHDSRFKKSIAVAQSGSPTQFLDSEIAVSLADVQRHSAPFGRLLYGISFPNTARPGQHDVHPGIQGRFHFRHEGRLDGNLFHRSSLLGLS